ncbi:UDP-N-acetylglucosamine 1-carboxyvinyltransferase [Alteribacillus iranensis]|uniref:UDP-N-acetylglucosamine 1-carboxyvinyltransferase n=1 Tax=Alteribacillus iranensis TaxID=930128 RepID=UPI000AC63F28|nr:UDP-N-acetylglucosamine 1-carboxyvinyltransferase [Alteribacillus iranensis]
MDKILVKGGKRLKGSVKVEGAKNAVLPVIAASLLAEEGTSKIYDVPSLADVFTMKNVLTHMNADVSYEDGVFTADSRGSLRTEAPFEYVRKMRASFLVMGPLLARKGRAHIALPGGCAIGSRPIDQHLKGFEAMGAQVEIGNGYIEARVKERLQGARIYLDFPSVGATENIMMAATLAEGTTVLENVAEEPEIVDLANYLNAMGAKVRGAGTGTIRIEGVEKMHGAVHSIIPDRIEAGSFMVAAAMTGGDVFVEGALHEHLRPLVAKMREMGVVIEEQDNGMKVIGPDILRPVDIKTMPHPGFPTDMQAQFMALLTQAKGTSIITETVFENRFMHVEEFRRMNADVKIEGRTAIVTGPVRLQGTEVSASDLRAGAALIIAGLVAEGETTVTELRHLDRGYVDFHKKLQSLGARVERISVPDTEQNEQSSADVAVLRTANN